MSRKAERAAAAGTKNLAEKIAALREKRGRYGAMLADLKRTRESQISLTDPESRAMAAHVMVGVGYNIQLAVDARHKMIVEQAVRDQPVRGHGPSDANRIERETSNYNCSTKTSVPSVCKQGKSMKTIEFLLLATIPLCLFVQALLCQNLVDLSVIFVVALSSITSILYCFNQGFRSQRAISTFAVLGLNITTQLGPMLVQTLSGRVLSYNLEMPFMTYISLALYQQVALLTHAIYCKYRVGDGVRLWITGFLSAFSPVYRPLRDGQAFAMGGIGFVALFITEVYLKDQVAFGDIGLKFLQALSAFSVAPVVVLVMYWFDSKHRKPSAKELLLVVGYTAALITLAAARNSRATFATVVATYALCALLAMLRGAIKVNKRFFIRLAIACVFLVPLVIGVTRLSEAMIIIRPEREFLQGGELLMRTISIALDGDTIDRFIESEKNIGRGYNENYISNSFFARMIAVKFHDNMLFWANAFTENQVDDVKRITVAQLLAILPTQIMRVVGIEADKKDDLSFTIMDYISYVGGGDDVFIGGYRSGSSVAHGLILWGWSSYLLWGVLFLFLVFPVLDSMSQTINAGISTISPVALITIWRIFAQTLFGDTVAGFIQTVTRDYIQTILLYSIMYYLSISVYRVPAERLSRFRAGPRQ